jgi:hypothetical protein
MIWSGSLIRIVCSSMLVGIESSIYCDDCVYCDRMGIWYGICSSYYDIIFVILFYFVHHSSLVLHALLSQWYPIPHHLTSWSLVYHDCIRLICMFLIYFSNNWRYYSITLVITWFAGVETAGRFWIVGVTKQSME